MRKSSYLRRRTLLGAAAGPFMAGSAGAQAGPGGVRFVPVPCPARDGDIVGLILEGPTRAGLASFGQPFRTGDLPRGATLGARRADGRPLRTQADATVRNEDGSVRHAIVTLDVPALRAGEHLGILLSRGPAADAVPLDLTAAASGREAIVEIGQAGGQPWRADLLRAAMAASGDRPWQSGPLAVSRRVSLGVPPEAVGGAASVRLVADVVLQEDGALRVDAWFRNDIAMRPGGGAASYVARVLLDGREVLRAEIASQHQYRGWGRRLGAARGGGPVADPHVRHDVLYLAETGATPRYDPSTGVSGELFGRMERAIADAGWNAPLGTRAVTTYMPTGGGRADIGPVTGWQAAWLATGDRRAATFCIGQAEACGTIPWHFWDPGGGADGRGGWLDGLRWPLLWTDGRGGPPPRGLAQPMPGNTGWALDQAHQPTLAFVPYLLTGRRAFADEVMAVASWNVVGTWPATRVPPGSPQREDGFLVVHRQQARGAAWSLRALDEAAWIAPDGDPNGPYLREAAARNFGWLRAQIPAWTELQGEAHGWLIPYELGSRGISLAPWQQDYVALTVIAAARRGREDARAFLSWMTNFLVGRFEAEPRGFSRRDGVAYQVAIGKGGTGINPHKTWAEVAEAMRRAGTSNGDGWSKSQGDYAALALASLAGIADTLDHAGARRAYAWLRSAGPPFTGPAARVRDPILNIVPRDLAPRTAACDGGRAPRR